MKRRFSEAQQEEHEEPGASTLAMSDAPVPQQLNAGDEDRASAILLDTDDEDRAATIVLQTDEASTILNPSEIFSERPDLLCTYSHTAVIKLKNKL